MFRRAICGGALKERFGCFAQRPGVTGSSVITSGPLVLPGMMGLLGVTLSRENGTPPYFSPEYTPAKPSGCAAACCSVQVSLPIEDKIAMRIPAVAVCSCETK